MWRVPYVDLGAQYQALKPEIDEAMQRVMAGGQFILRDEVSRFEEAMAEYLGVKYVIGVGNGYDALFMSMKAIGICAGDKVLVQSYTHISTHAAIANCGAKVVLNEAKPPLKAVIAVHMNGRIDDDMRMYGSIPVIEDACQALGAAYSGVKAGTVGKIGCFSCHPMKVLSCAGDGGFIATNDGEIADFVRSYRNHGGGKGYGVNSRLDNLQAAILNVKLPHLDSYIARRREIASMYEEMMPIEVICPPPPSDDAHFDTYSSYVVSGNFDLLTHLRDSGIETFSHINLDTVSLPIYPEMSDAQVGIVVEAVKAFYV